jgi:hypothetical protein
MVNKNSKKKWLIFILVLVVAGLYGLYEFIGKQNIEKKAAYFKGTLVNSEATKGANIITIKYVYRQTEYQSRLSSDLGNQAIGRQYFIQFLPAEPDAIVFHKENLVPDCLTTVEPPIDGWKKIPECP